MRKRNEFGERRRIGDERRNADARSRSRVFGCTCTARFLEARFGRNTIDAAVMSFYRHSDRLRAYCAQGGPGISD
jgi:hypothetical protein